MVTQELHRAIKQIRGERQIMQDMKAKMSITVDADLVHWIDAQVKTLRFRNRSHAVEVALRKFLESEVTVWKK